MTTRTLPIGRTSTSAVSSRETTDWRFRSACRQEDPELFFPVGSGPQAWLWRAEAKEVCGGCKVRSECLDWALETRQSSGVFGGMDALERAGIAPPKMNSVDWCRANQELIEKRRADGVSWRKIALELNVKADAVRRAMREFEEERSAGAALVGAASEAVAA